MISNISAMCTTISLEAQLTKKNDINVHNRFLLSVAEVSLFPDSVSSTFIVHILDGLWLACWINGGKDSGKSRIAIESWGELSLDLWGIGCSETLDEAEWLPESLSLFDENTTWAMYITYVQNLTKAVINFAIINQIIRYSTQINLAAKTKHYTIFYKTYIKAIVQNIATNFRSQYIL